MDTALVLEVARNTGPIGGLIIVLFFIGRDWKMKIEAKIDELLVLSKKNETKLEEHGRRIVHIERSTTTQPIDIREGLEGGAT